MIRLVKSLAANVATLLLSFVLAAGIWVVAVREADPPDQRRLDDIPVQVIGRPPDSAVSGIPDTVEVQVEGPSSVVSTLTIAAFTAEVDLSGVSPGITEVPVNIRHSEELVEIVWQSEERIAVEVEPIVSRDVPVRVEVRGNAARGYELGDLFLEPTEILVTGVASRVETLAEARITAFLDSPQQDVTLTRRPVFYDRQGNIVSVNNLDLSADEVQVTIPVNQLAGFAAKPIIVDWEGDPAQGYRLLDVSVEPDSVLVTGPPGLLESLSRIRTEPIDITGLRESVTQTVALALPAGIELDEVQPVLVGIVIEPILTSHVIRKTPEIRALGEGLTVTVGVEEVRVFLFGPLDKLDSLVEDDVRVTLDLFGLDVGTHGVELDADVFVGDVEIRSVQPPELTVNITRTMTTTEELTATESLTDTTSMRRHAPQVGGEAGATFLLSIVTAWAAALPAAVVLFRRERVV